MGSATSMEVPTMSKKNSETLVDWSHCSGHLPAVKSITCHDGTYITYLNMFSPYNGFLLLTNMGFSRTLEVYLRRNVVASIHPSSPYSRCHGVELWWRKDGSLAHVYPYVRGQSHGIEVESY
jgi:hypothetical protein